MYNTSISRVQLTQIFGVDMQLEQSHVTAILVQANSVAMRLFGRVTYMRCQTNAEPMP